MELLGVGYSSNQIVSVHARHDKTDSQCPDQINTIEIIGNERKFSENFVQISWSKML